MPQSIINQARPSLGFQVMSLANSTAGTLNSTCVKARAIIVSVETNDIRLRMDGTKPTLSTGVLLTTSNGPYYLDNLNGTGIAFQRTTGTAKVSIQALKNANDHDR